MIAELRDQHVGQKARSGKAAFDRTGWRRRFNHAVAAAAGELRPHVANDLEALRDVLQLLGNIFAELPQLAAAIRTAIALGNVRDHFAVADVPAEACVPDLVFGSLAGDTRSSSGFHLGLRRLLLFQFKLELLQLE